MKQAVIKAEYYSAKTLKLNQSLINKAAINVVKTLNQAGYDAYLVGGCIRDLMLEIKPKDFDISTKATPNQIKNLFPRARIIGQRFKIVHVMVKSELLEIATFRQAVQDHHKDRITGQVLDDNVYGTLEDDASRRDFTVNAFYYDVNKNQMIDFFNGKSDLANRRLKLIGDPDERFAEDPGRILRTVRFQAKFGFKVSDGLVDAIYRQKHLLNNIPPARRFDELIKLFYCGKAETVWKLLNDYEVLPYLFAHSEDKESKEGRLSKKITQLALAKTDQRIKDELPVISSFMFCAILWPHYQKHFKQLLSKNYDPQEAMVIASEQIISQQLVRTGMLRRVSNTMREIWWLQFRFEKMKNRQVGKIISSPRFRAAYDFLLIRSECGDVDQSAADFWTDAQVGNDVNTGKRKKSRSKDHKTNHHYRKKPRVRR